MKLPRIDRKTLKVALAITICCVLHIIFSVIAKVKEQDKYIYAYIPIVASLTTYFCVSSKNKGYIKATLLQILSYVLIITFSFLTVITYTFIVGREWPFMVLTEPLHLIVPTIYICLGTVILTYITILLKSQKHISQYMILYILFLSVNFYNLRMPILYVVYIISILIGGFVALCVNVLPIRLHKNNDIKFLYCLDGLNKKIDDKIDNYEAEMLSELIDDNCNISFYSRFSLPLIYNKINDIKLTEPVLCNQGAILYDYNNKLCLYNETIDYKVSNELDKLLNDNNISAFRSFVYDNLYYTFNNFLSNICDLKYKELMKNQIHCQYINVSKTNHLLTSYTIFDTSDNILSIETLIKRSNIYDELFINLYNAKDLLGIDGYYVMNIMSKNVLKQNALSVLKADKKLYSISYSKNDALIYFKSDYVITNKKASKDVLDKTNYIINSKRDHSLVRIIKKLYYKKASH